MPNWVQFKMKGMTYIPDAYAGDGYAFKHLGNAAIRYGEGRILERCYVDIDRVICGTTSWQAPIGWFVGMCKTHPELDLHMKYIDEYGTVGVLYRDFDNFAKIHHRIYEGDFQTDNFCDYDDDDSHPRPHCY